MSRWPRAPTRRRSTWQPSPGARTGDGCSRPGSSDRGRAGVALPARVADYGDRRARRDRLHGGLVLRGGADSGPAGPAVLDGVVDAFGRPRHVLVVGVRVEGARVRDGVRLVEVEVDRRLGRRARDGGDDLSCLARSKVDGDRRRRRSLGRAVDGPGCRGPVREPDDDPVAKIVGDLEAGLVDRLAGSDGRRRRDPRIRDRAGRRRRAARPARVAATNPDRERRRAGVPLGRRPDDDCQLRRAAEVERRDPIDDEGCATVGADLGDVRRTAAGHVDDHRRLRRHDRLGMVARSG